MQHVREARGKHASNGLALEPRLHLEPPPTSIGFSKIIVQHEKSPLNERIREVQF